jgi:hypothetical protein
MSITALGAGVAAWGTFKKIIKGVSSVFSYAVKSDFKFQVS